MNRHESESEPEFEARVIMVGMLDRIIDLSKRNAALNLTLMDAREYVRHERELRRYAMEDMGEAVAKVNSLSDFELYEGTVHDASKRRSHSNRKAV